MDMRMSSWLGAFCWLGLMQRMKKGWVRSTAAISLVSWPRNFSPTVVTLPACLSSLGGKIARVRTSEAPASSS